MSKKTKSVSQVVSVTEKEYEALVKVMGMIPELLKNDQDKKGWVRIATALNLYQMKKSPEDWNSIWNGFRDGIVRKSIQSQPMSGCELVALDILKSRSSAGEAGAVVEEKIGEAQELREKSTSGRVLTRSESTNKKEVASESESESEEEAPEKEDAYPEDIAKIAVEMFRLSQKLLTILKIKDL